MAIPQNVAVARDLSPGPDDHLVGCFGLVVAFDDDHPRADFRSIIDELGQRGGRVHFEARVGEDGYGWTA
jgi:hypothetical protein